MHLVQAKTILSPNNGVNIYRGCTHGCIYCDSRSDCYNMNHDFEDIEVKANAPQLLDRALASKRKKCMVGTGAMSDPYNPLELELRLWRQCLEIIDRHRFGATFLTKSDRFLRDIDLLASINDKSKAVMQMTLTTADENLCRIVEPNVSTITVRYRALKTLQETGIPNVVWLCPLLPYINDTPENLRAILDMCFDVGTKGIIMFDAGLTLRDGTTALISTKRLIAISLAFARCMSVSMAFRMPSKVLVPRSSWRCFARSASAAAFFIRPMRFSPSCANIHSHMSSSVCSRRSRARRCKRSGRLGQLRARFNWQ